MYKKRHAIATGLLSAGLFSCGLIPDYALHGLSLLGWLPLFLLLHRTQSTILIFIASLTTNLIVSAVGLFWLDYFSSHLFLDGVFLTFWILPFFFIAGAKLIQLFPVVRPIQSLIWAGLWWLIAASITSSKLGDPPLLGFFSFPLAFLQMIRWTSYVSLTAFWIFLTSNCADYFSKPLQSKSRTQSYLFFLSSILFIGNISYGIWILQQPVTEKIASQKVKMALIQHHLGYGEHEQTPLEVYPELAREAAKANPDWIIFPLYSLPLKKETELSSDHGIFNNIARDTGKQILTASRFHYENLNPNPKRRFSDKHSGHYSVTAFLYTPDQAIQTHNAADMSFFHNSIQDLNPELFNIFETPQGKAGVLICYESEKPKWAKMAKKMGADFLIGLADPADFSRSLLPYYQLAQNKLRAIETGLYFIRVTPGGFTAVIDPQGRVINRSNLREQQILNVEIPAI